jgi:N-acetylneuraminate synthase/N,N'-diacetyllegionaminate synthase
MKDYDVFIPARVGSTRLPFKHFRPFMGRTLIEHLLGELAAKSGRAVTLICPEGKRDDLFEELLSLSPVSVFRGNDANVLERFFQAVEARKGAARYAVRLNGDCAIVSSEIFDKLAAHAEMGEAEIITTVGTNVPSGLHLEAVRVDWLMSLKERLQAASPVESEHVFPLLYAQATRIERIGIETQVTQKLSIDNYSDYQRVAHIAQHIADRGFDAIDELSRNFTQLNPFMGGNGPFLIAEIGGNHEGDFEYAKKLVTEACETDVDAVKLQIYSPDLLVNRKVDPLRWSHFRKFALSHEQYVALFEIIRAHDKKTCASVWSIEEITIYKQHIDILKVGSGDLTDFKVLSHLAGLGKPLVISTGLAEPATIKDAYTHLVGCGMPAAQLAILQCTSMYPIPDVEANLAVMDSFRSMFDCSIGYSDHTVGYEALIDSVAAGADVLEFHFSDDVTNTNFRDHLVSLNQQMTAALVLCIRRVMMRRGSAIKHLTLLERSRAHQKSFRKAVYLRRDLPSGHRITEADLITLRPCEGINAQAYFDLIGKVTSCMVAELEPLAWSMFE